MAKSCIKTFESHLKKKIFSIFKISLAEKLILFIKLYSLYSLIKSGKVDLFLIFNFSK